MNIAYIKKDHNLVIHPVTHMNTKTIVITMYYLQIKNLLGLMTDQFQGYSYEFHIQVLDTLKCTGSNKDNLTKTMKMFYD